MRRILERCCTSPAEVAEAKSCGADRAELCVNLPVGGTTPLEEDIGAAVSCGLPVNVLVRPRGGGFVYSGEEVQEMVESIGRCGALGANGVVVGALTKEGRVDVPAMQRMVSAAREEGLEVTFHRAFDECAEPFEALEDIIALGCTRLLTSGCKKTALEGAELIAQLVERAERRIIIMPGSGVTPQNIDLLQSLTGAAEFHGSRLCAYKDK